MLRFKENYTNKNQELIEKKYENSKRLKYLRVNYNWDYMYCTRDPILTFHPSFTYLNNALEQTSKAIKKNTTKLKTKLDLFCTIE